MSFPFTPRVQDEKLESLQTQYEYLKLLRLRHLQWMSSADAPRVDAVHQQVADRIEDILDHYKQLLETLQ